MSNILAGDRSRNPFLLDHKLPAIAYVDTIKLYLKRPLPDDLYQLLEREYVLGDRLFIDRLPVPLKLQFRQRKRWIMTIHQPSVRTIEMLATRQSDKIYTLYSVHLAIDLLSNTYTEADDLTEWIKCHAVQNWPSTDQHSTVYYTTTYFKRSKSARRNAALYGDKASKVADGPCAHLELRFTHKPACDAAGLNFNSLIHGVDVMSLLQHQFSLKGVHTRKFYQYIDDIARRAIIHMIDATIVYKVGCNNPWLRDIFYDVDYVKQRIISLILRASEYRCEELHNRHHWVKFYALRKWGDIISEIKWYRNQ